MRKYEYLVEDDTMFGFAVFAGRGALTEARQYAKELSTFDKVSRATLIRWDIAKDCMDDSFDEEVFES